MTRTKKSLLVSVLSLVLCVAMLLGTTYAWFTDSVQSGINTIVAGNLDVELYHAAGDVTDDSANKVSSNTMLFNMDKWEPGVVVYENFMVKNVGDLALKYQLGLNIGDFNQTADGKSLADVLKVALVPDGFSGSRADAQAITDYTDLKSFSVSGNGALVPGESQKFGVVIYWQPGENDNDYNLNNGKTAIPKDKFSTTALGIELGVKLSATQLEYEYDSFGNDYDGETELPDDYNDSKKPVSSTVSAPIVEGKDTVLSTVATPSNEDGNSTKVTFPKEVASFTSGSTSTMTVEATPTVAANNKFTISANGAVGAIDLTVKVNDTVVSEFKDSNNQPVPVIVETYVAKNLTNVSLQYNGTGPQPTDVVYDKTTGKLSWKTTHFSTFVLGADEVAYVESNNMAYLTLDEAMKNVISGDTVTMLKDYYISNQTSGGVSSANVIFDLNKNTITSKGTWLITNGTSGKPGPITATIKNGTYVLDKTGSGRIRFEKGSTGIFQDMTFKTSDNKWYQALQTYATNQTGADEINSYSFNNCSFENCFVGFEGNSGSCNKYKIDFNNCEFTAANMLNGAAVIKVEAYGYGAMNVNNTTFDINNTSNGGYCVNPGTIRSYTNNQKMSVSLNNVTMKTNGNAYPYTYTYDYNGADGSRDWSAEVICSGDNVFTHNGKNVQMFIMETSATYKSVAWTENPNAYKACLAEWVAYATAKPADYNSMNYYLVECDGCYYIGGQGGQQFNDNATITKDGDTVTQVKVSGYYTTTYTKVGTTDISTQLGDADNPAVHIYTLATK